MWRWIIFALVALIVVLLIAALLSQLIIRLKYIREEDDDEVTASMSALFGLVYLRYRVPAVQLKGLVQGIAFKIEQTNAKENSLLEETISTNDIARLFKKFRKLVNHMLDYKDWLTGTLAHIHVHKVRWRTRIGAGDAPETAVTTGIVWSIKSSLLAQLLRYFKLETQPNLAVDPDFNKISFRTEADLHMHVRLYRIVYAMIMLSLRVIKKRGGWKAWFQILFKQPAK